MKWRGILLALGLGTGCTWYPDPRLPRVLAERAGLVISNSPMFSERRVPRRAGDRVLVDYTFLLENAGEQAHTLLLAEARTVIEKHSYSARCREAGLEFAELVVAPGARHRISCELGFSSKEVPLASLGDREAVLVIPARIGDGPYALRFTYLFHPEDGS